MTRKRKFIKRNKYRKIQNKKPLQPTNHESVINLSNEPLNEHELSILSKGLSFCPTPKRPDSISTQRDLYLFYRRIRLDHHFNNNEDNQEISPFKTSSGWTPRTNKSQHLNTFLNVLDYSINQEINQPNNKIHKNLSTEETTALNNLRHRNDIVIKPADKGGAIVVMNRTDYLQKAMDLLNEKDHYLPLDNDLTSNITKDINKFLSTVQTKLPDDIFRFNRIKHTRTPLFYILPKVHKMGIPGRPIVSAIGGPTEKLSATVDHFLKPLAQAVPSYIQDTTDFLLKLKSLGNIPPDSLLVTADVSSLYTSIPHREGILATKEALDAAKQSKPPTWILLRFLHLILTKNCFEFDGKFYLQTQGTSMGTKCAPNYAIIFMDQLEQKFLSQQTTKPLIWWRFIDDIFMIWTHHRNALSAFMERLNQFHKTIKFTFEVSDSQITFLDTTVTKLPSGALRTSLYSKPTDAHLYLHYSSCHPKHQIKSIPKSQALRIRRICSDTADFENQMMIMKEHFLKRGYPAKLINKSINTARQIPRENLLERANTNNRKKVLPLVTTFNPRNPHFLKNIRNHSVILNSATDTSAILEKNIIVAYRRTLNLKDILVHAKANNTNKTLGSSPCNSPCHTCPYMKTKRTITSHKTGAIFKIKSSITCTTPSVVYVIECRKCGIQYVGQTSNNIQERMRGHFYDIKNANEYKQVSRHFSTCNHHIDDVIIIGVATTVNNNNIRLRTEEAWITNLRTLQPDGLNIQF
ncbi:uncharacterized protein [Argopecten irradians]|uniref:uncharacterized protein n=1 Tax=Argopecten irradians TaxID=31199 RepID=UPI00371E1416